MIHFSTLDTNINGPTEISLRRRFVQAVVCVYLWYIFYTKPFHLYRIESKFEIITENWFHTISQSAIVFKIQERKNLPFNLRSPCLMKFIIQYALSTVLRKQENSSTRNLRFESNDGLYVDKYWVDGLKFKWNIPFHDVKLIFRALSGTHLVGSFFTCVNR